MAPTDYRPDFQTQSVQLGQGDVRFLGGVSDAPCDLPRPQASDMKLKIQWRPEAKFVSLALGRLVDVWPPD